MSAIVRLNINRSCEVLRRRPSRARESAPTATRPDTAASLHGQHCHRILPEHTRPPVPCTCSPSHLGRCARHARGWSLCCFCPHVSPGARPAKAVAVERKATGPQEGPEQDVPHGVPRVLLVVDALRLAPHLVRGVRLPVLDGERLAVLPEAKGDGGDAHAQVHDDVRLGALRAPKVEHEGPRLLVERARHERVPRHVDGDRRVGHLDHGLVHGERRVARVHQVERIGRGPRAYDGHVLRGVVGLRGPAVLHRVGGAVARHPRAQRHVKARDLAHLAHLLEGEGRLVPRAERDGDCHRRRARLDAVVLCDEREGLAARGLGLAALGRGTHEGHLAEGLARLHRGPVELLLVARGHLQIENRRILLRADDRLGVPQGEGARGRAVAHRVGAPLRLDVDPQGHVEARGGGPAALLAEGEGGVEELVLDLHWHVD
mmetsp:Transcript_3631/g.12095  ORF Transcript_3631/g.12095 Transcript_3631/m.12095 type:complete len:432 (+) Transcript_3631:45-1340(+)